VRFSAQGEFKNTKKTFWGKSCQKLFAKKLQAVTGKTKKNPVIFFLRSSIFFIAFLAVSLHDELKSTPEFLGVCQFLGELQQGEFKHTQTQNYPAPKTKTNKNID
jgi:hypothetical protein